MKLTLLEPWCQCQTMFRFADLKILIIVLLVTGVSKLQRVLCDVATIIQDPYKLDYGKVISSSQLS